MNSDNQQPTALGRTIDLSEISELVFINLDQVEWWPYQPNKVDHDPPPAMPLGPPQRAGVPQGAGHRPHAQARQASA